MADPGDRIEAWLNAEVEPLAPPPGTFQRIRRRSRRRKAGRAVMSAAGIVIVIVAAFAVPHVASTMLLGHNGRSGKPVAASGAPSSPRPSARPSGQESLSTQPSPSALPSNPSSLSGGTGAPVPRNFQPTSVTFVGPHTGVVIGQAGTPGHCPIVADDCTSLAGTSDYGASWYGVSAPVTGAPDGSAGVGQIRFLNTSDGWAFGPQLWVTHDGGAHWTREQTGGMRVTDLETAGDRAFAIFASCTGSGPDYGAHCTSVSLYSSAAGSDQWQAVPGPVTGLKPGAGIAASASLVLVGSTGGTGYLLAPSGELLAGPLTGAAWKVASPAVVSQNQPCLPGAAGPGGQPTGALLAASPGLLVLVCTSATSTASDTQAKALVESTDGGAQWSQAGSGPAAGIAASVAVGAQDSLVLLASDAGLYRSGNGGSTWHLAQPSPAGAAPGEPGFSYVGMTSASNGVALPADPGLHEVFVTTDSGASWQAEAVSAP
jgi:hypothetical protein